MNDIVRGILDTARDLRIDPLDLATAISYETGGTFDPTKRGPTTKWGQHRGLIQFGEPQARQFGVDWNNPVGSQLGANGAVSKYFRSHGLKPGMGMMDIYSIINAGGPGRYNASDAAAGGAPGTVADKVNNQMAGHRQKAASLLSGSYTPSAQTALTQQPATAAGVGTMAPPPLAGLFGANDQPGGGLGAPALMFAQQQMAQRQQRADEEQSALERRKALLDSSLASLYG